MKDTPAGLHLAEDMNEFPETLLLGVEPSYGSEPVLPFGGALKQAAFHREAR